MLSFVYLISGSSILPDMPTQWKEMRNLLLIYMLILKGYARICHISSETTPFTRG
jgi:hypothetical protein